jgi:hypothetical protein
MIRQPTVFVLGAGASLAYGFPSGARLVEEVLDALRNGSAIEALRGCGVSADRARQFGSDLRNSTRQSIDAFLESRQDYDEVGRLVIAQRLLLQEREDGLRLSPPGDWCATVFAAILGTSVNQFHQNALKVITFNFDRSFERKMYLALEANYPNDNPANLVRSVPVLHIHGRLGAPDWLPGGAEQYTRPYARNEEGGHVIACSKEIHIVHHSVEKSILSTAKDWLSSATRVCFLGFSYHELNLEKLDAPAVLAGKNCAGTTFGIDPGPLSRVRTLLGTAYTGGRFVEQRIEDFVRELDWLHE